MNIWRAACDESRLRSYTTFEYVNEFTIHPITQYCIYQQNKWHKYYIVPIIFIVYSLVLGTQYIKYFTPSSKIHNKIGVFENDYIHLNIVIVYVCYHSFVYLCPISIDNVYTILNKYLPENY